MRQEPGEQRGGTGHEAPFRLVPGATESAPVRREVPDALSPWSLLRRWIGRKWSRRAFLTACGLLTLAGCNTPQPGPAATSDPLLDGGRPRPLGRAAAQTEGGTVPPLSAPSTSTSTAALSAGTVQPLDGGRELRIPNAENTSSAEGWRGQGAPGEVALNRPQPLDNGTPAPRPGPSGPPDLRRVYTPPAPSGIALMGGARPTTYEQAQAMLKARGVTWYRLETWGDAGEVKFSCSIPNPQNPNIRRNYEARAHDELSVLRGVLDKIDADQH